MRRTVIKIIIYCVAIAMVTLAFSAHQIQERVTDSEQRIYLLTHGSSTVATKSNDHCPYLKNSMEVTFKDKAGQNNTECISRIGDDLPTYQGSVGDKFDIVYDPADRTRVYLAPGGNLPQRNVHGAWKHWLFQNIFVLLIIWSFVAFALWREEKKRRFDEQLEQ